MIKKYVFLKLTILCIVGFLCFSLDGFGQGTTCATATPITLNGSCLSGTIVANSEDAPLIGTCVGTYNREGWYTFTVSGGTQNIIISAEAQNRNLFLQLISFTGTCTGPSQIACANANTTNNSRQNEVITATLANGIYYIKVVNVGGNNNMTLNSLCVTTNNNNCTGALPLVVNATETCTVSSTGTTMGASQSITAITCNSYTGNADDDVWYSFVATATSHNITVTDGTLNDAVIELRSGACNGTNINCSDSGSPEVIIATSLTIGTTYYVRVYSYGGNNNQGTFDICVTTPVPPCSAITTIGACGANVTTTIGSGTGLYSPGGCGWTTPGKERIYSFTPTVSGDYYIQQTASFNWIDYFFKVAGTCDGTGWTCIDALNGNQNGNAFNLIAGTTYYIMLDAEATSGGNVMFNIVCPTTCISTEETTPTCGVVAGEFGTNGADPAPLSACSGTGCVELEVDYLEMGNTTSYRVEQIPYNPAPISSLLTIGLLDDYFSSIITFPAAFGAFCFYGTSYPNFVYGANGVISFDSVRLAGQRSGYLTTNNIPSTVNAVDPGSYYFGPSIFGVHHDIDPSITVPPPTMLIGRAFDNIPGCERMIMVWEDVPMFYNNTILYSGQMILYKNSNIIEVHITKKSIDSEGSTGFGSEPWNYGNGSVGLQRNSTTGIAAPCRNNNDRNWITTNESWRFVPNAGDISELKWYADINDGNGFTYVTGLDNDNTPNVCPSVTTNYRAIITYTPACGLPFVRTDDVLVTVDNKVWNGNVNTNWYIANNWTPSGVPTSADCVIIPDVSSGSNNFPIADVTAPLGTIAHAKTLIIRPNASLQLNADTFLEVVDAVTVDAAAGLLPAGDFLIRSTGSLVQVTDVLSNNNTGNIRMQRTVPGGVASANYVYWSSPVEGFNVDNINTAASELRWEWEPTTASVYGNWLATSGAMAVGKGYIVRGLATPPSPIPAGTVEFSGRPSNGIINVPINRGNYTAAATYPGASPNTNATNLDDNWNLIGNPYPSAISGTAFITENASGATPKIDGTIYLWSHVGLPVYNTIADPFYGNYVYNYLGSSYVSYNGTGPNPPFNGNIAAGQSFFVQMIDAVGTAPAYASTVRFDNTMRGTSAANDNFLRTSERHRVWLNLINQNNDATSTLVGYVAEATNDKDMLYDGNELSNASQRFYSLIGADGMTIQGRALPFNEDDKVPLGFRVPQIGTYKIAIHSVDGLFDDPNQNMYLEDTYTNTIHDLRTSLYSFTSESGTFDDRFILRYTNETLSTPDQIANFGFNITGLKDYIKVSSNNSPINTVMVYDVLGRVLADYKNINTLEFKLELPNQSQGTLIVKATLYNGQQKIKKVIY